MKINLTFDWCLNEYLIYEVNAYNGCNACWVEWEIIIKRKYEGQPDEMIINCRFENDPTIDEIKNAIIGHSIKNAILGYNLKTKKATK